MLEKISKSPPPRGQGRDPPATLLTLTTLPAHRFEINFLTDAGDIAFHVKPRFSSATVVGNAFQGGQWGQEEVSSVFPLTLGEPFEVMGPMGERRGRVGDPRPMKKGTVVDIASFSPVSEFVHKVLLSLATNYPRLEKRGIPSWELRVRWSVLCFDK